MPTEVLIDEADLTSWRMGCDVEGERGGGVRSRRGVEAW